MIKRILVPVKATKGSEKAIDVACEMASQLNASVHFITVDFVDMPEQNRMTYQLMEKAASKCKNHNIEASYSIISAESEHDVPIVISNVAKDHDLIIMGHCKYEKIYKFLRGSVAEDLIKLAPCPVVVAAAECEEDSRNQPLPVQ